MKEIFSNLEQIKYLYDDFNYFVNNKWEKKNKIPSKYTKWGTFEVLNEENLEKLKKIIKKDDGYIKLLNKKFMDTDTIEKLDSNPIDQYINKVDSCKTKKDLWELLPELYKFGFFGLFYFVSGQDTKNSNNVVPQMYSGGLGLPDRNYYIDKDKEDIRNKYKKYLIKCWKLYYGKETNMDEIFNLEKEFAKVHYTNVEKRDPELLYNKITNLNDISSKLDFKIYINKLINNKFKISSKYYIIIDNKKFYKKLEELWTDLDLNIWKKYIIVKLISNLSSYLSSKFYLNKFNFYNKELSGQKDIKPRDELAINFINSNLGELLGKKYVDKYFPEKSKKKVIKLINTLQDVIKERIKNLSWMSDKTKEKALLKHKNFTVKVGYPDKWTDFSKLKLDENDNLISLLKKCNIFYFDKDIDDLYKPPDLNEWGMDPHTINAYFSPTRNEIVFPAGILQYPFFDPDGDDAWNYGAIGTVIGHEITHSYDDKGGKFDENGELNNWWTKADKKKFNKKTNYYIKEYNTFKVNGNNVNGELTLGENLADHGGVKIAYYALKKSLKNFDCKHGFNPYQRFFISWANIWKANVTEKEANNRLITDVHAPNEWRVNGTLANIPEFHLAFNIEKNDKMWRDNPPQIW